MKIKLKRTQLLSLQDGTPFTLPSCPEFKYMYLVRGGDCTCRVQGYKLNENGVYMGFSEFFSPATEVLHDSSRLPMHKDKDGFLSIVPQDKAKEALNNPLDIKSKKVDNEEVKEKKQKEKKKQKKLKKAHKMNVETIENTEKPIRGRKRKYFIELPHNEEFTVSEVAKKLGVKNFVVSNEITKLKKEFPDCIELIRTVTGGKGKPARVYKLK